MKTHTGASVLFFAVAEKGGGEGCLYAEEISREAVFDAIRNRRCYATTGVRIVLEFKADDHWMGEEYRSNVASHLTVKVIGTADLESVTIVRNNSDYLRIEGRGRDLSFATSNTDPPKNTDYYYVRVIQKDGEMAWSSPIWVSRV